MADEKNKQQQNVAEKKITADFAARGASGPLSANDFTVTLADVLHKKRDEYREKRISAKGTEYFPVLVDFDAISVAVKPGDARTIDLETGEVTNEAYLYNVNVNDRTMMIKVEGPALQGFTIGSKLRFVGVRSGLSGEKNDHLWINADTVSVVE